MRKWKTLAERVPITHRLPTPKMCRWKCGRMGTTRTNAYWMCDECRAHNCSYTAYIERTRKEQGLCKCGAEVRPGHKSCEPCAEKIRARGQATRRADLRSWASRVASSQRRHGKVGITLETVISVWERDGGRCFYTGAELTFGENASIDHKVPFSDGGTDDLSNLCLVHTNVNKAKLNLPEGEFLAMCRLIADRFPRHERAIDHED